MILYHCRKTFLSPRWRWLENKGRVKLFVKWVNERGTESEKIACIRISGFNLSGAFWGRKIVARNIVSKSRQGRKGCTLGGWPRGDVHSLALPGMVGGGWKKDARAYG